MRLLMTTDTVGGVWTFTCELISGLLEVGNSVALVSLGRMPDAHQARWAAAMKERWDDAFHFEPTDVPLEWMQNNATAYTDAEALLLKLAHSFGAELIHSNQFCFGALPSGLPRVVTAHSDVLSWATACGHSPLPASAWIEQYRTLTADGLSHANEVVTPTQWMLGALGANFGLPANCQVVANGRTLTAPSRERKLQAITAGRMWDAAKGISLLQDIRSSIPLVIAGNDREFPKRDFGANVRFLGPLSGDELQLRFAESAMYVCTSIYEPFGLAPLEAALCGCAVLANDIPSLREVWQDGALYFGDAESLSQVLETLSSNLDQLCGAQTRSFQQARKYSGAAMTSSYLHLFEQVLARSEEQTRVA